MNNTKYIEAIRGHLCHALTESENNDKTIKRVRERIEDIEMLLKTLPAVSVYMMEKELDAEMEFCETLNDVYNAEINRLTLLVLKTNTEMYKMES
jgi:hypothetical protein